ncbi:aminoacyl-tRNA deacylase [Candidatus Endoriftia persephonae]|nr:YbaK/EbsC family protein [Candidatus Endoriftia persephone]KRT54392.1 Cys-tRNA(Pro) deacylase, prolyl-tRNA editing enzyme YbaK/EbsC [endosymbiont of Ridgeia piscesae]KRT57661.1 Ala-tRNA(Pro) deacylase [endosymbiont of Ridgeia piscesae]USF88622.1 YbaK/EbsC family protein [Candidatus Endoriftia persephone]
MTIATSVMNMLNERHIPYEVLEHAKTATSPQAALAAHVPDDHIAKGVLMKDNIGYMLAVIPGDQWLDRRRLSEELGRDLRMASEEEIGRLFSDCDLGAIPPLGSAYGIDMMLDEDLSSLANVYFEAGDHEHLLMVDSEHFHELMRGARHGHLTAVH